MKSYLILKSFKGSQNGTVTESFEEGTLAELSDYLVESVNPDWIEPAEDEEGEEGEEGEGEVKPSARKLRRQRK